MTDYDSSRPGMEALDALLESETFGLTGSGPSGGNSEASFPGTSSDLQSTSTLGGTNAEGPRQGLLTTTATSTERMAYSLSQLPYSVAANNAVPLPSDMQDFMGNVYRTVEQSAHGLNPDQCPIMPAPTTTTSNSNANSDSASFDPTMAKPPPKTKARTPRRRSSTATTGSKRNRDASAVSEDEGERHKRRQDRNAREQQRSHRITEQIDNLKQILGAANVSFKPDKFSTLVTVSDYIKELQAKSAMLDAEHKKLIDTISRTNDIVHDQSGAAPMNTGSADPVPAGTASQGDQAESQVAEGHSHLHGPTVDYRSVFTRCGVALAVLSIDGRFLDCNQEFERITSHTRSELLPTEGLEEVASLGEPIGTAPQMENSQLHSRNLSLFNLLSRDSMEGSFTAMSEMLKHPAAEKPLDNQDTNRDFWTGVIGLSRQEGRKMQMNISLVRSPDGRAKFFDCALTPVMDE